MAETVCSLFPDFCRLTEERLIEQTAENA